MSVYQSFTFLEGIESRYHQYLPHFLRLNNISEEGVIIRLLLGTLGIEHNFTNSQVFQKTDYSIVGRRQNNPISTRIIRDTFGGTSKLQRLESHLISTRILNRNYFTELKNEIACYFFSQENESYTKAFLHLYRIVEYISYSFPLVYAAASRDYYGTFNRLKNYFSTAKNELTFFDNFIENLFTDNTPNSIAHLNFNSGDNSLDTSHYRIMERVIKDDQIFAKNPGVSIEIQYRHVFNMCVDTRNRYFHFAMGAQRNIKATEILESDIFFGNINEIIMNWIAVVYFEILNKQL